MPEIMTIQISVTRMNFVGNYYKRGTNSTGNYAFREKCKYDRAYFSGNWMNSPVIRQTRGRWFSLVALGALRKRPHTSYQVRFQLSR